MIMEKNRFRYTVLAFFTAALIPFFFFDRSQVYPAGQFTWFIILLGMAIIYFIRRITMHCFAVSPQDRKLFQGKNELVASVIITFLFLFALPFWDLVTAPYIHENGLLISIWGFGIYLPSVIFSVWLIVFWLIRYLLPGGIGIGSPGFLQNKKTDFFIIAIISLIYLFSTYPGPQLSDVLTVWGEVVGDYQLYNGHPLGYVFFVKLCSLFTNDNFSVCVVQTVIWLALNYYILSIFERKSRKAMGLYTVILCVSQVPFQYLQIMYKDTVFAMGMLALIAGTWNIIDNKRVKLADYFILGGVALFVTLFRFGGYVTPILAFVLAGIYLFIKNRKAVLKFLIIPAIHIVFYVVFNVVLLHTLDVKMNSTAHDVYGVAMSMIAGAAAEGVEFDPEDVAELEKVMPVSEWAACYDKYWVDSVARWWGKIGDRLNEADRLMDEEGYGTTLLKINAKILFKHPIIYFKAFLGNANIIWQISRPPDMVDLEYGDLCYYPENEETKYSIFYPVTKKITIMFEEVPLFHTLFWRGGIWLFFILASCVILWIRKKKWYIAIQLPVLSYYALMCFVIPADDPKYTLSLMESAIFIIPAGMFLMQPKPEIDVESAGDGFEEESDAEPDEPVSDSENVKENAGDADEEET